MIQLNVDMTISCKYTFKCNLKQINSEMVQSLHVI